MFKRTIIASAVLLATSTAWAASTGNQAEVTQAQFSSGNLAYIQQVEESTANKAAIYQQGNDNLASTEQRNTGASTADIKQAGGKNEGEVLQQGVTNKSTATIDSNGAAEQGLDYPAVLQW